MLGQIPKQTMLYVSNILCLTTSLLVIGCGKKDLSPPPVNSAPHDKVEMALSLGAKGDVAGYRVNVQIEYGNMSTKCSHIDSFGGHIDYPHGYVSVDMKNNSIEIYRDYYQSRDECSWRLLGLGIYVYGENGRLAIGGLPANDLQKGYMVKLTCDLRKELSGACAPGRVAGIRSDLIVDLSIH